MTVIERRQPTALTWLLIAIFLLWVVFVLAAYYVVQNAYLQPLLAFVANAGGRWQPLQLSAAAPLQATLDLAAALWLTMIAFGLGQWLLERYELPNASPLARMILATGLGF